MEIEEIYCEIEDEQTRMFLARQLKESQKNAGYLTDVDYLKTQLNEIQTKLEYAKIHEGLKNLMKKMGWKEFDVSDYVNYDSHTYFDFIGTEEEYNTRFGDDKP